MSPATPPPHEVFRRLADQDEDGMQRTAEASIVDFEIVVSDRFGEDFAGMKD